METPFDISAVLSSQARFRVLRALWAFDGAMSLRGLEGVSGLAVRSVQVALSGLTDEGIVTAKGRGRERRYRLSASHPCASTLASIFGVVTMDEIRRSSLAHAGRAKAAMRLSEDVRGMYKRAKSRR